MSKIVTLGLSKIEVGEIAVDGGMGTSLAALGYTYENTCTLAQEEPQTTEFFAEEVDDPVASTSKPGQIRLNFSIMDADADALVKIFGGEKTGTAWSAPAAFAEPEMSVKVTPTQGLVLDIPRAKIRGRFNSQYSKNGLFLVEVTATVMAPSKTGEPKMKLTPKSA